MNIKQSILIFSIIVASVAFIGGCRQSLDTSDFESATNSAESSDQRKTERLFDSAIEALNRLEQDSSEESGDRVTGRLNEWIKTTPELKDWTPDPMTPVWQKNIQKRLPFFNQVAQQIQFARQDISITYDKCIHLFDLQQELDILIQKQEAGAIDQKTLDRIAQIQEEGQKINSELESYQTPKSIKKLLEYLPKIRQFLADNAIPAFDPWNLTAFDTFVSIIQAVDKDGLKAIVNIPHETLLGVLDSVSAWFSGIAGDFALEEMSFPETDIYYLQESIWLRDASEWAQGSSADDLSRVTSLFDWTMKNIALESSVENHTSRISEKEPEDWQACRPLWNILLTGRGTAIERAWVFARLAEHQGLDVALVYVPIPERPIPPAPAEQTPPKEDQPAQPATPSTVPKTEEEKPVESVSTNGETEPASPAPEQNAPAENPDTPSPEQNAPAENTETPSPEQNAPAENTETPAPEQNAPAENTDTPAPEQNAPAENTDTPATEQAPEVPEIAPPERFLVAWIAEDKIYFFDPEYGIPIPAPDGITLSKDDKNKGLKIVPATLKQIQSDKSVLDRMSFTDSRNRERKYYLEPEDFNHAEYYLPVNPLSLSKRMWILQARLTGDKKIRLTSSPSEVKARLNKIVPGAVVDLWVQPYVVPMFSPIRQSEFNNTLSAIVNMTFPNDSKPLRRARITYLKGTLAPQTEDDDCAVVWYQNSRFSEGRINQLAISKTNTIPPDDLRLVKLFATYWLGLLSDALDNHEAAEEYFNLVINNSSSPVWTPPALYNIGRVEEETGQFDKAIDSYQKADGQNPLYIGAALRAQWLKELGVRSEE